jgi:hypothetical protein
MEKNNLRIICMITGTDYGDLAEIAGTHRNNIPTMNKGKRPVSQKIITHLAKKMKVEKELIERWLDLSPENLFTAFKEFFGKTINSKAIKDSVLPIQDFKAMGARDVSMVKEYLQFRREYKWKGSCVISKDSLHDKFKELPARFRRQVLEYIRFLKGRIK